MKLCDIVLNKILICDTTAHTGYFWIIYRSKIGFLIGCEILQQYHFRRNNNNNNKNRWFEWRFECTNTQLTIPASIVLVRYLEFSFCWHGNVSYGSCTGTEETTSH